MNNKTTVVVRVALAVSVFVLPSAVQADALTCNLTEYKVVPGLTAAVADNTLAVTWDGDRGNEVRLRFTINGGTPTIQELAVRRKGGSWGVLASNVMPEFQVVSGLRRMANAQLGSLRELGIEITPEIVKKEKWEAFWDAPLRVGQASLERPRFPMEGIQPGFPRKPEEIKRATAIYQAQSCGVKTNGTRLEVSFPGVQLGVFSGKLQYTVYKGTNLVLQEVIAKTDEASVAYKYDAGLKGLAIQSSSRMLWHDTANNWQDYQFGGAKNDGPVPLQTSNRLLVAERQGGSIAVFPPPHNFFWAREIDTNLGYSWYRKDSASSFSFGIRQPESEAEPSQAGRGRSDYRENFALYSARPGTLQRMSVYFYVSPGSGQATIESALAFTRGDRYVPVPGYQVMVTHFHGYFVRRLTQLGVSLDAKPPDFEAVKAAGINIFAPIDGGAGGVGCCPSPGDYIKNLATLYEIARRHSDKNFLVMPSVEITPGELSTLVKQLGGHWDLFFSHPVLYSEGRASGQPLTENDENFGKVYRLGSAGDVMEMMRRENVISYMAHPRSKGSTNYPDAIKDTARFRDENFRGIGFRWGMGLDRSEQRLCEYRCLATLDDMNNWVADLPTPPKYLQAISEFYQQGPGDDIYANNPVNYVKVALPGPDNWKPIVDAMKRGDYFVTSGEVLIPNYAVLGSGNKRTVSADVEWTFPLEFVEVVWGDGQKIDRQIISATDLAAFGKKHFEIPFDATGKKWVRFAAWDSAGNGALVQPIKLTGTTQTSSAGR